MSKITKFETGQASERLGRWHTAIHVIGHLLIGREPHPITEQEIADLLQEIYNTGYEDGIRGREVGR